AAIGPTGAEPPTGVTTIDGRGKLALPGLVNAHNHAALALLKGTSEAMPLEPWLDWLLPVQRRMEPEDIFWSTQLACLEQTRHGVTTFADMLGQQEHAAPAIEVAGLRAVLSKSVMESDPWGDNPAEGLARLD